MLQVIEYFAKSLEVIRNDTLHKDVCVYSDTTQLDVELSCDTTQVTQLN